MEAAAELAKRLAEPLWELGEEKCAIRVLQVVQLIMVLRERHRMTNAAFADLLSLLKFLLPPNRLPGTPYRFLKCQKAALHQATGGQVFSKLDLCSDAECTSVYLDATSKQCPDCNAPRYRVLKKNKKVPHRQLRYLGVRAGLRILVMSRKVSLALSSFNVDAEVKNPTSFFSSLLSEHLCHHFIPYYDQYTAQEQQGLKARFFITGQACTQEQYDEHVDLVASGGEDPTRLVVVEGGCDAFQPFRRRQHSTWLHGYRLVSVDPMTAGRSEFEIVTAISEGTSEGKAALTVAALDGDELEQLRPWTAFERQARMADSSAPLPTGCSPSRASGQRCTGHSRCVRRWVGLDVRQEDYEGEDVGTHC